MRYKRFLVGLFTFIIISSALILIGEQFSVDWLKFSYEYEAGDEGFFFSASSFLPFIIGLAASAIAEKIYVRKLCKKAV